MHCARTAQPEYLPHALHVVGGVKRCASPQQLQRQQTGAGAQPASHRPRSNRRGTPRSTRSPPACANGQGWRIRRGGHVPARMFSRPLVDMLSTIWRVRYFSLKNTSGGRLIARTSVSTVQSRWSVLRRRCRCCGDRLGGAHVSVLSRPVCNRTLQCHRLACCVATVQTGSSWQLVAHARARARAQERTCALCTAQSSEYPTRSCPDQKDPRPVPRVYSLSRHDAVQHRGGFPFPAGVQPDVILTERA